MTDIDHLLASLGQMPLDPRLGAIDDAVMDGLYAARQPVVSNMGLGAVVAMAMVVGAMAAVLPAKPAEASPVMPFGVPQDLAPSALLGDAR
jgi:hypothetical protein